MYVYLFACMYLSKTNTTPKARMMSRNSCAKSAQDGHGAQITACHRVGYSGWPMIRAKIPDLCGMNFCKTKWTEWLSSLQNLISCSCSALNTGSEMQPAKWRLKTTSIKPMFMHISILLVKTFNRYNQMFRAAEWHLIYLDSRVTDFDQATMKSFEKVFSSARRFAKKITAHIIYCCSCCKIRGTAQFSRRCLYQKSS